MVQVPTFVKILVQVSTFDKILAHVSTFPKMLVQVPTFVKILAQMLTNDLSVNAHQKWFLIERDELGYKLLIC